jgi:hypothetical protein
VSVPVSSSSSAPVRRSALAVATVLAAAMVGCLVLAAAMVGCSAGKPPDNSAEVSKNAARLDDLHRRIMGNVAERVAGERVAYEALHGPLRTCVAAAGLTYYPPPFVNVYAGMQDSDLTIGFAGTGWLAPISTESFGVATAHLRLTAAQPNDDSTPADYQRLSEADKDKYQQAVDSCAAQPPTQANVAAGAAELITGLDDALAAVTARAPVKDMTGRYPKCMKEAGFSDVGDPAALADTLSRDLPDRQAMPLDGRPAAPAWEAVVAAERKAARADAQCRRDIYGAAMGSVGPDLDKFESDHAAEITAVRGRWVAIVAEAAKL